MIRFCFARTLPVNIMKGVCVGCYLFLGTICVHIHLFPQKSLAFLHNVMYHIHVEVGNSFCCQDWETFPVDRNNYFSNELNGRETQVSFSFLLSKVLIFFNVSLYYVYVDVAFATYTVRLMSVDRNTCFEDFKREGRFISLFFLRKRIKKAMHHNI